ncbi:MAG: MFS transporter [Maricaulaceae bacterium]|nr:MFS transporter [Maricaulaceae bacterium]
MSARIAVTIIGQRRFAPMLAAQTLGAFNDNMFRNALVILVTYEGLTLSGLSPQVMAPLAATLFTLPLFLFSALSGQIADRYDRAAVMKAAKLGEIFLMLVAALGFLLNSAPVLFATLFLMGTQSALFSPAKLSALPVWLKDEELVTGNALVTGFLFIAVLLGVGAGVLLIRAEGGPQIVSAILVGFAVLGWLTMRAAPPCPSGGEGKPHWNFIAETVRVLGIAWRHQDVMRPLLGIAWFWLLSAVIVIVLIPLYVGHTLGYDETVVMLFMLIFTVGSALGCVACGLLARGTDALRFSFAGAIGVTFFSFAIAAFQPLPAGETLGTAADFLAEPHNWTLTAWLALAAISAGLYVVPLYAMAQRRAPQAIRARLMAAGALMNAGAASIGQLSLIALDILDIPNQGAFAGVAGGSLLIALFIAWRLLQRR